VRQVGNLPEELTDSPSMTKTERHHRSKKRSEVKATLY